MFLERITDNFLAALAAEFNTRLTREQGDAVRAIGHYADAEGVQDPRQVAYMIATAWHEARFKPIAEIRAKQGTAVYDMQEKYWNTGYYGRGLCQLTWKRNYEKFSALLGLDLVSNPDLVLDIEVSARILVLGMARGLFSGKKLGDYFQQPPARPNWLQARRTVNGDFQADKVADAATRIFPLLISSL